MQEKFNQNNQINSSDTPERFSQPSQSRFSRPKGNGKKQVPTWLGVLIIALAAVLIFGGVFAYQYSLKSQTPTPNVQPNLNVQTQTSEPTPSETEGWKTYINKEYGFEFKYPEDFIIYNAISNPLIKDIISFKDNKSLSCGIWSFPADDKDYSREKLTTDKKYERLEVNNVEIFKSAIKEELGGGKGLQMFLFSKNGEEFNLACHISDNAFNEGLSAFNQTLSTFRFTNSTNQTAGWKTYTNSQYGFEIKYPSGFLYWDPKALIGDCNYNVFPEQCPNINDIVASEQISEGGDPNAVQNNISNFPKGEKVTINNTTYCLYKTGDVAAGSLYYDYYYATIKSQKCFIMRLVTRLINCGVYGSPGDKAYDDCNTYNTATYPQNFNQVLSTFKFTK